MASRISLISTGLTFIRKVYTGFAVEYGAPMRFFNLRVGKTPIFFEGRADIIKGDPKIGSSLLKGHFIHSVQLLDVGAQGDIWALAAPSEKYAEWLHGFHWLPDILASKEKSAIIRARELTDSWIGHFGKWNSFAWNPDILTHRLYNLLAYWAPALSTDSLSEAADIRRKNIVRQLKRLSATYSRLPKGPIRLKAAAVLAMGGVRRDGRDDAFFQRGLDLLDDEIAAQILSDGGLSTRNPNDIVEMLDVFIALDQLIQSRGIQGSPSLTRAIDRMQPALNFFQHRDGKLGCFNGGGEGNADKIKQLLKRAKLPENPFLVCPNTGYQRVLAGEVTLIFDTGETPAIGYDYDAHQAPLAFELSTDAGRLIVNCGRSAEFDENWNTAMRQTDAHSSLILNDQSVGKLIPEGVRSDLHGTGFLQTVGQVSPSRREMKTGIWLEANHNGYADQYGLCHRRRIYVYPDGSDIRGEDTLYLPVGETPKTNSEIPYKVRFHLHPDVVVTLSQDQSSALIIQKGHQGWRLRTDVGPLKIEKSIYCGEGAPRECQQIIISSAAFGDGDGEATPNRVRWSLRRIEKS